MHAMILAAGRGQRMRPLTDKIPKPLLTVKGKPLIVYHVEALVRAGIHHIVINLGNLGHQIQEALGEGQQFGASIQYSAEDPILETGGGIVQALPLLGKDPFVVVSADIYTDFPFQQLPKTPRCFAHLVLVDNPPFHPQGDFGLSEGIISNTKRPFFNFSGIAVYHPKLFSGCEHGIFPVSKVLKPAIEAGQCSGEYYAGSWDNIGTPEQLGRLNS